MVSEDQAKTARAAQWHTGVRPPPGLELPPPQSEPCAELGKLLAADEPAAASPAASGDLENDVAWPPTGVERVTLAARILATAHEELCIAFGIASGGGAVGREMRALAQRLESEMRALRRGVRNVREFG
jgi:hypothetical protein